MKRFMFMFLLFILVLPAASAEINIHLDDESSFAVHLDDADIISQTKIPDANFTSKQNYTFTYQNAIKITYKTDDGKQDYFILWKANGTENMLILEKINDLDFYYSDYCENGVFYVDVPLEGDYAYGVLFDTTNVSCNESHLVKDILNLPLNHLSSETIKTSPVSWYGGFDARQHYNGPVIDPYDVARNDPYSYYDYFDYEDNVDIDEYLYDSGYDE